SLSNNILGGPAHLVHDLDIDDATDTVVSAGKSATWITQNPWATNPANVGWRPFVRQEGSGISRSVLIHPADSLKVGAADVDRAFYTWTDGAEAQPRCHLAQIVDAGVSPSAIYGSFIRPSGKVILGRETTMVVSNTDPWQVGGGTWVKDSLASVTTGDIIGVAEFISDASDTIVLAASSGNDTTGQGGIFRKVGAGAWPATPAQSFPGVTDHQNPVTFLAADGSDLVFCLAPTAGLYRSANAGASWTLIWPKTVPTGNQRWYGRAARDPATPATLYVSWGDAGLWQVTGADAGTLNANGTTATGTITAAKLTQPGLLAATSRIGAIAVDATTSDLVACRLANDPLGPGL
ncbi:MAG: hypothetical protein L0Y54_23610, partial [Sporichthyaceae bacterium]|nr:hypothetical protein [Sporichthyaceae bacterium]